MTHATWKDATWHQDASCVATVVVMRSFLSALPLLPLLSSTIAFQNHAPMTSSQPHSLRDGSHNHPSSTSSVQAITSSREHCHGRDHDLRDGSHNHPATNTLSAIEARLATLNLVLPPPGGPKANYVSGCVWTIMSLGSPYNNTNIQEYAPILIATRSPRRKSPLFEWSFAIEI